MRSGLLLLPLAMALACGEEPAAPWLTYPGIEGHSRFLPLVGTAHDPGTHPSVTCDSCHPGATFSQPVCTGCHTRPETAQLHTRASGALLDGYRWTPVPSAADHVAWERPSCLECHPQGGVPDVAHEAHFPIGAGTPHDRSCGSCHADPLDKANLSTLRCVACHRSAAVRAPLPGSHAVLRAESYPAAPTPADCLRCHAGAKVLRVAAHGSRRGPAGYGPAGPRDGEHGEQGTLVNCFSCHNAPPPYFDGRGPGIPGRRWAQDWRIPATTAGQTAAGACRGCHGPM